MTTKQFRFLVVPLTALFAACNSSAPSGSDPASGNPLSISQTAATAQSKGKKVPNTFQIKLETSKGDVIVEVNRDWAPEGAKRLEEAVKEKFYDECRFFRVVPGFVVQFGINGDPKVQRNWRNKTIRDDEVKHSNKRGTLVFATAGPNTRTTQLFINLADNAFLDRQGFSPVGTIQGDGMKIIDKINAEYEQRPDQGAIQARGNEYLKQTFPNLDFIKKATLVSEKDDKDKKKDGE